MILRSSYPHVLYSSCSTHHIIISILIAAHSFHFSPFPPIFCWCWWFSLLVLDLSSVWWSSSSSSSGWLQESFQTYQEHSSLYSIDFPFFSSVTHSLKFLSFLPFIDFFLFLPSESNPPHMHDCNPQLSGCIRQNLSVGRITGWTGPHFLWDRSAHSSQIGWTSFNHGLLIRIISGTGF